MDAKRITWAEGKELYEAGVQIDLFYYIDEDCPLSVLASRPTTKKFSMRPFYFDRTDTFATRDICYPLFIKVE